MRNIDNRYYQLLENKGSTAFIRSLENDSLGKDHTEKDGLDDDGPKTGWPFLNNDHGKGSSPGEKMALLEMIRETFTEKKVLEKVVHSQTAFPVVPRLSKNKNGISLDNSSGWFMFDHEIG